MAETKIDGISFEGFGGDPLPAHELPRFAAYAHEGGGQTTYLMGERFKLTKVWFPDRGEWLYSFSVDQGDIAFTIRTDREIDATISVTTSENLPSDEQRAEWLAEDLELFQ